jgi:hypothetical protein
MGNLARLLQQRFREAAPAGWSSTAEQRIMSADLERQLGFAPRADVLLAHTDGSQRIWIEFEISRADPVANHAVRAAPVRATGRDGVLCRWSLARRVRAQQPGRVRGLPDARGGHVAFQTSLLPRIRRSK